MITVTDLQTLINQAAPGDTVAVPGGTYQVDTRTPITVKSDITLDLSAAVLQALPSDRIYNIVLRIDARNNVTILNGVIVGERDIHVGSTEWSMGGGGGGIHISGGSRNIKVLGTKLSAHFADGVYVEDAYQVEISRVTSDRNRRQGMSVIQVDGLVIDSCQFSNSGGTPPGCGIDLECDTDAEFIRNVQISRCVFVGNQGASIAVGSPGTYSNIRITPDNDFDMVTQPIWAAGNAAPLGTSWWAFLLNRVFGSLSFYRWWGYRTEWTRN